MTEFATFVAALTADPDGAGAFADFLDERGDPRAVLLRRRWRRWQKDRWAAAELEERERAEAAAAEERERAERATRWGWVKSLLRSWITGPRATLRARVAAVDATFVRYIRRKFASEAPEPTKTKKAK
jgi:uncharacterized protein (TIGR02996 family)